MVRAWDPHDNPDRLPEQIQARETLNTMRAECIRRLRAAFGADFHGGFMHTDFAKKRYPDLLMPDPTLGAMPNYVKLMRQYPICIATTGLHRSIGWKFAEYVAASKAIVSEKLHYEVPGGLEEDKNYLRFDSAEECVEKTRRLYTDRDLRSFIMTNNADYYQSSLKPSSLVLNTLRIALSGANNECSHL